MHDNESSRLKAKIDIFILENGPSNMTLGEAADLADDMLAIFYKAVDETKNL